MWIRAYRVAYQYGVRPFIFNLMDAQTAHEKMLSFLEWGDRQTWVQSAAKFTYQKFAPQEPTCVGGVNLDFPLILAAGFVKGRGFASEEEALKAVESGENIIQGWRTMPHLVGAVELGSFTRFPRLGNSGQVIWRDASTQSTQNRFGLKNAGARASAAFLAKNPPPKPFGVNLAVSPQVTDADQEEHELVESLEFFKAAGVSPNWVTLNLSCPNTEDDPSGNQTEEKAQRLCCALLDRLDKIPLWVKVSPCLGAEQYHKLMRVFANEGVSAVIATNTLAQPTPTGAIGGVGGGGLYKAALEATQQLIHAKQDYPVDIIGCGGVLDYQSYQSFRQMGVQAVQYWSALVYQGPLAYAVISGG